MPRSAIDMLKQLEGFRGSVYKDQVGVETIGTFDSLRLTNKILDLSPMLYSPPLLIKSQDMATTA